MKRKSPAVLRQNTSGKDGSKISCVSISLKDSREQGRNEDQVLSFLGANHDFPGCFTASCLWGLSDWELLAV